MVKVLIIEDDTELCEVYADMLRPNGHEVISVNSGAQALRTLGRVLPEVVILDIHLPGLKGDALLYYIRSHPKLLNTKVIIASGFPEKAQLAANILGADSWLAKPITAATLRETIAKVTQAKPPIVN